MLDLFQVDKHEVNGSIENLAYEAVDKFHAYDEAFRIESVYGFRRFGKGSAESLYAEFKNAVEKVVGFGISGEKFFELLTSAVDYYNLNALCPCDIQVDASTMIADVSKVCDEMLESTETESDAEISE